MGLKGVVKSQHFDAAGLERHGKTLELLECGKVLIFRRDTRPALKPVGLGSLRVALESRRPDHEHGGSQL